MLRAYSRDIVQAIAASREVSTFIPALAYTYAHNPTEIEVEHAERAAGDSKYSLYQLVRLNFDLVTGFSLVPLQMFSLFGMLVAVGSLAFYLTVILKRALMNGWEAGFSILWDRDLLQFFLIGMVLFGIGLLGEYVGRIYSQVRDRPRYMIKAVLERNDRSSGTSGELGPTCHEPGARGRRVSPACVGLSWFFSAWRVSAADSV